MVEELGQGVLEPAMLERIAAGAPVALAAAGLERMGVTRAHLVAAQRENRPIYGVTTGLGPRVVERLSEAEQAEMSMKTIRGRAHSAGAPLPRKVVRAALAIRAETLMVGASGADPALARCLADWLNAGLSPIIPDVGSVGAADLMWGGNFALGLIGEGEVETPTGLQPAAAALAEAGIAPYRPGVREGLAMVSHSSIVAALAGLGVARARGLLESVQTAAALSMEGFRANVTPFLLHVRDLRPQAGQGLAAEGILQRLDGSDLLIPGHARRLQDPLSFRNIAQVHGAGLAALEFATAAAQAEMNAASDNPVVLADSGDVMSAGGFLTPHLAVAVGALNQALVHVAAMQTARIARMMSARFTDLPVGLAAADTGSAGMAPATKTAEALCAEITQAATPAMVYPSGSADGVEDVISHSAIPAKALHRILDHLAALTAIECIAGAQAVELRAPERVAPLVAAAVRIVRRYAPPMTADRGLSAEIAALAEGIGAGDLAETYPD